jgi:hypothetical protein
MTPGMEYAPTRGKATLLLRRFAILCLAAQICSVVGYAQKPDQKGDQKKDAPAAAASGDKAATRNNAASLLADLLGQDKNVSKILIIKHNSPELGKLIKAISKTAGDGEGQIQALAKSDPGLNLHATDLPPGEKAARASDGKATEHDLLSSSGATFEFKLLLTQAQAMGYGSQLAKVAAENSSSPEQTRVFHSLEVALSGLHQQVLNMMRPHAAAK